MTGEERPPFRITDSSGVVFYPPAPSAVDTADGESATRATGTGARPAAVSHALRTRLARTIADEGHQAVEIDAANDRQGWLTIEEAVRSGVSYYVRVKDDFLAVDFDDDPDLVRTRHLYALLMARGCPPVVVASGREGHVHLFARVNAVTRKLVIELAQLTRQEVRDFIRPPLTPSQRGEPVHLMHPATPEAALSRLRGDHNVRPLGGAGRFAVMSDELQKGKSVSESAFSAALAAVNARWELSDLLFVVESPRVGLGYLLRHRSRHWSNHVDWLSDYVWPKAVQRVAESPPVSPFGSTEISRLAVQAVNAPWPGPSGASRLVVYLALLSVARRCGQSTFDASQRELAVLAGISGQQTVARALKDLETQGWIQRLPTERGVSDAATWELNLAIRDDNPPPTPGAADILHLVGEDAFRNSCGLGQRAAHLFLKVHLAPGVTTAQLVTGTGVGAKTLRAKLKQLLDYQLLERDSSGGWTTRPEMLPQAATDLACAGRSQRQIEQYTRERDAHTISLDRAHQDWERQHEEGAISTGRFGQRLPRSRNSDGGAEVGAPPDALADASSVADTEADDGT